MAARIDPDEALARVLAAATPAEPRRLPLADALGAVLAEDVRADRDYPPFDRAMMDGFAVRLADAGGAVDVVGFRAAGGTAPVTLPSRGGAVEIMTGAECPPGTEAVVPVENVERDGDRVALPAAIRPGANIASRGHECAAGALVVPAGTTISALVVGVLATFGRAEVLARAVPRLAIVTTGDELAAGGDALAPGRIRDSNGPMLEAMARLAGVRDIARLHADDEDGALDAALARAAAAADVILLSGGVSAGRRDLVPGAIARLGARTIFHGVTQKPGKPLLFAASATHLFFGLPGNPLAVHLGFHRYVAPALRARMGLDARARAELGHAAAEVAHEDARTTFALAVATPDGESGCRVALLGGAGSADLFAPAMANAYVRFPPGRTMLEAGEPLGFEWIGEKRWND